MDTQSTFTVVGHLRPEYNLYKDVFGDKVAQILFRADIRYAGHEYKNVVLLTLEVKGHIGLGWHAEDSYPHFLPFMKAVPAFREYLITELEKFRWGLRPASKRNSSCPLWMGVGMYINELKEFDDARSLAAQVKRLIDRSYKKLGTLNDPKDKALFLADIKAVIKIFGDQPMTDKPFAAE